jgi:hypothetical protein
VTPSLIEAYPLISWGTTLDNRKKINNNNNINNTHRKPIYLYKFTQVPKVLGLLCFSIPPWLGKRALPGTNCAD